MTVSELLESGIQPINWRELEQLAAPNPVIPDLLHEGESGSLVAQAGAGKSLLVLEITVALALGKSVLGTPPRDPVTVMYVDMENPQEELGQRLRSMGYAPADLVGHPLHYFSFPDLPPLDTTAGGRMLALQAEIYQPQLIVFDTISRLVEGKEDSADTWTNLYNHTMIPLRRQGRAVLRLDHQGHDASRGARGSSAKRDDVDVAWIMKRSGNKITLTCDKGRGLSHPEKVMLTRTVAPTSHLLVVAGDKQAECVAALNLLAVPLDSTRDDAAAVLRSNGYGYANVVVGAALKARRSSPN